MITSIGVLGENELKTFIVSFIESGESMNSRLNRLTYYTEMVLSEPSILKAQIVNVKEYLMKTGEKFVIGFIRGNTDTDYYYFLKEKGYLKKGSEFLFYFYAIKNKDVYSHHKDVFKAKFFRFYKNKIEITDSYKLEPILCRILSNRLMSKKELVERLNNQGFNTNEEKHYADFYYVLKVKVESDTYSVDELKIADVNSKNGNDTFSPHSPKVICC